MPRREGPREYFAGTPFEDVLVAERDGEVVRYVQLHKVFGDARSHRHVLEISGLAVHPDASGRGIGA